MGEMVSRGIYCLCIKIEADVAVRIGALGRLVFPRSCYVYVGSAMNGMEARVRRHLKTATGSPGKVHWHIDYLLKEPEVSVKAVYTVTSGERMECVVANALSKHGQPVRRFGCSDCHCESHLFIIEHCSILSDLGLELSPTSAFI